MAIIKPIINEYTSCMLVIVRKKYTIIVKNYTTLRIRSEHIFLIDVLDARLNNKSSSFY